MKSKSEKNRKSSRVAGKATRRTDETPTTVLCDDGATDAWTDEERQWIAAGCLAPHALCWTVNGWTVWKGMPNDRYSHHRMYRSPGGRYYLGTRHDVPPYRQPDEWCSDGVWPGCRPEDSDRFRRAMASNWLNYCFHYSLLALPEDLRSIPPADEDAFEEREEALEEAAWDMAQAALSEPDEDRVETMVSLIFNGLDSDAALVEWQRECIDPMRQVA